MKKLWKLAAALLVAAMAVTSCSRLFEDDEELANRGGGGRTSVDGRYVDHAPNDKLIDVLGKAGLLDANNSNNVDVSKISNPNGGAFDGFIVKMPGGTTQYVKINPNDGSFIKTSDQNIPIPVGTKIEPIFIPQGKNLLTYTITDVNGKECTVPVIVDSSATSAKWSVIEKAAKDAGVNLGPAGPGGSTVTDWKYGSGSDYSSGTAVNGNDPDIPSGNKIGPVLTTNYSISDGSSSYPATYTNVTYPNAEKTLQEIFDDIYIYASNKSSIDGKIKANYPSISSISKTDFEQGKSVTAPSGKTFGGWKVTTPDGTVKIVKPSEIAGAGNFPAGTKIEPNWIDSPSLSLSNSVDIDFTKIFGGDLYSTPIGDFYIANTEITRAQWKAVMMENGTWLIGDGSNQWSKALTTGDSNDMTMPMNYVNWYDAILFCNRLSDIYKRTPYYIFSHDATKCKDPAHQNIQCNGNYWDLEKFYTQTYGDNTDKDDWLCIKIEQDINNKEGFRIPDAIYWEYAARGGKDGKYTKYSGTTGTDLNALKAVAWFGDSNGNSKVNGKDSVHPVGLKGGDNPVRDMTGNVWEWCWDLFINGRRLYIGGPFNGSEKYQPIDFRAVYKAPNGKGGEWTAIECANGTANETNGYAGSTGDRSEGMGIRLIVPVLNK